MKRLFSIILVAAILMAITLEAVSALGEPQAWDCPECGRMRNVGNYCGFCGNLAPWMYIADFGGQSLNELEALIIQTLDEAVNWTEETVPQSLDGFPSELLPSVWPAEPDALMNAQTRIEKTERGYRLLFEESPDYPLERISQFRAVKARTAEVTSEWIYDGKQQVGLVRQDDGSYLYEGDITLGESEYFSGIVVQEYPYYQDLHQYVSVAMQRYFEDGYYKGGGEIAYEIELPKCFLRVRVVLDNKSPRDVLYPMHPRYYMQILLRAEGSGKHALLEYDLETMRLFDIRAGIG